MLERRRLKSYAVGGRGVLVEGPRSLHFASMRPRIARSGIAWSRIVITSRVIPVQMSQPNDIVSIRIRPSGYTSRT